MTFAGLVGLLGVLAAVMSEQLNVPLHSAFEPSSTAARRCCAIPPWIGQPAGAGETQSYTNGDGI
jgi:hypothetical protein